MSRTLTLAALLGVQPLFALPIQGLLNQNLSGTYQVQFKMYADSNGTVPLWTESQSLSVADGHFQTQIGAQNSLPSPLTFKNEIWLDIEVLGVEHFSQRLRLPDVSRSLASHTVYGRIASGVSIDDGLVVKSLNGLRDQVRILAGTGLVLNQEANELRLSLQSNLIQGMQNGRVKLQGDSLWSSLGASDFVNQDSIIRIKAGAVSQSKLADGSVTTEKLVDASVSSAKLIDGSVSSAKLADGSVGLSKLVSGGNSKVLSTDGSGALAWKDQSDFGSSSLSQGQILIGNAANVASAQSLSGDASLSAGGVLALGAGVVTTTKLADGSVSSAKLIDASVTTAKLADGSVTSAKVIDGSISTAKLADGSVSSAKLVDGSVGLSKLVSGGNSKVLSTDGSGALAWKDQSDFGSSSLSQGQILIGNAANVASAQSLSGDASLSAGGVLALGAGVVTTTKLADGSVSSAKLIDASVTTAKLADGSVTSAKVINGSISTAKLADGSVTTAKLADGSVSSAKLADASVGLSKLVSGGNSKVLSTDGSGALAWKDLGDFSTNALNQGQILIGNALNVASAQSLSGDASLSAGGVLTLGAGVVGTSKLADASVSSAKVIDGSISTAKLADGSVSSAKLVDGSVGLSKLVSGGNSKVLSTDGSGALTWKDLGDFSTTALTSAKIWIGNASNVASAQSLSGDASLSAGGVLTLGAGVVTTTKLADASVTTAKFADASVSSAKLIDGSVATSKLADGSVSSAKLADASVGLSKLVSGGNSKVLSTDGSGALAWKDQSDFGSSALNQGQIMIGNASNVASAQSLSGDASLSAGGVLTLGAGVVTTTKLADASVTAAKLADASVSSAKLADASVGLSKLVSGGNSKVLSTDGSGALAWKDLGDFSTTALNQGQFWIGNASNVASAQSLSGDASLSAGGVLTLGAGVVTTTKLADASVTTAKLADGSVSSAKLADASVGLSKLVSGGNSKVLSTDGSGALAWKDQSDFGSSALNQGQIMIGNASNVASAQSLSGDASLSAGGVLTLGAGVVGTSKIADASVSTAKLVDGSVSAAKLANASVTGAKIAMGSDAQGDLLYYNGSAYVRLPKGSAGQVLTMNAGATAPSWENAAGGGGASGQIYGFSHAPAGGANEQLGANGGIDGGFGVPHVFFAAGTITKMAYHIGTGGVGSIQYSLNGGAWTNIGPALTLPATGVSSGLSIAVNAGDELVLRFTDWFNMAQVSLWVQ